MCDQSASNQSANKELKATMAKPFFYDRDGNKVFALFKINLFCLSYIIKQADQPLNNHR